MMEYLWGPSSYNLPVKIEYFCCGVIKKEYSVVIVTATLSNDMFTSVRYHVKLEHFREACISIVITFQLYVRRSSIVCLLLLCR